MILPDVNVLVFAFRREAERHDDYARWLSATLAGAEDVALADAVLAGFVRIVTNSRIMAAPAPTVIALSFVDALLASPASRWLPSGDETWRVLGEIAAGDPGVRGNLVPDAYLAALARTHGARIATADRGFRRFPGVRSFDPVSNSNEI